MFSKKDLEQIKDKNIDIKTVNKQIENFKNGFPYANIQKPATVGDGIIKLSSEEIKKYADMYETASKTKKIVKFVPASGAASRMFKMLFSFAEEYNEGDKLFENTDFNSPSTFFKNLEKFAFYDDLNKITDLKDNKNFVEIVLNLLTEKGLNYGNLPKGLLKFHKYKDKSRTPAEEHLIEGANYGNSNGTVNIHFTVSHEHKDAFKKHISEVKEEYEKKYDVKYNIEYSEQESYTDTIAVDMDNEPFRNSDDSLLFRPGGHGALIENLNKIDADIIFIKNIDNVVPDRLKKDTYTYKKALAGLLLETKEKIYSLLKEAVNPKNDEAEIIRIRKKIEQFFTDEIDFKFPDSYNNLKEKEKFKIVFLKLLNPVRVCGMVKNEGEPGGGPFFVKSKDGSVSLQIIESAQINNSDSQKIEIVKKATHFNPVDLIISPKNPLDVDIDLKKHIDYSTGFISTKSKDGKELKAQELPGLWNGAMYDWNTIFVEVPISTFNPVKVVNDLLRDEHQA